MNAKDCPTIADLTDSHLNERQQHLVYDADQQRSLGTPSFTIKANLTVGDLYEINDYLWRTGALYQMAQADRGASLGTESDCGARANVFEYSIHFEELLAADEVSILLTEPREEFESFRDAFNEHRKSMWGFNICFSFSQAMMDDFRQYLRQFESDFRLNILQRTWIDRTIDGVDHYSWSLHFSRVHTREQAVALHDEVVREMQPHLSEEGGVFDGFWVNHKRQAAVMLGVISMARYYFGITRKETTPSARSMAKTYQERCKQFSDYARHDENMDHFW